VLDLTQLRICFLAGTLAQGGAERQLFYMLKALRSVGASPHLLCLTQGEFWEEPIRALGVPITWVGQAQGRAARVRAVIAACRELKPQILQSQHFYTNLYAALAARWLGLREIGAVRASGYHEVLETGRLLGWLSLNLPRQIAANSQAAVAYTIEQGAKPERVFFLPNVIDDEAFAVPDRQQKRVDDTLQLLTIGRLEPQKRVDRLLNLIAQLRESATRPFKLTIAGDGSLRAALEAQARALGLLPELVEFRGIVKNTAPLYRAADMFLLTSDFEGTPNVMMEAMAAGLPIVCTNVGGVAEIIESGKSGLTFAPRDESGFLAALVELINNPARQAALGAAAHHHIAAHHSLTRLPQAFAALYQQALGASL
jgi:glycosyltransferase involved in cell wall biosynthesis